MLTCNKYYLMNTELIIIPDFHIRPDWIYQLDGPIIPVGWLNMVIDNPVKHLSGFLILPVALIILALVLIAWTSFNSIFCSVSNKEETQTKTLIVEQCSTRQNNFDCLPDWLQKRKEMIFPNTAVIKGQKLGKGQFGIVFKGVLVQGNAVYVNNIKLYHDWVTIY